MDVTRFVRACSRFRHRNRGVDNRTVRVRYRQPHPLRPRPLL